MIAPEHFHISQAVVAPSNRLRTAQVRVCGKQDREIAACVLDERQLQGFQIRKNQLDRLAREQSKSVAT